MKRKNIFLLLLILLMGAPVHAQKWAIDIMRNVETSLAKFSIPGHVEGLVTGCLVKLPNGKVGALTVCHGGGKVGAQRDITVYDLFGREKTIMGTVKYSGTTGFHNSDFSFLPVPEVFVNGNNVLRLGEFDPTKPVYVAGYRKGHFDPKGYFITQRRILGEEGMNFLGDRLLPGETPGNVINFTGACGSPLLQADKEGLYLIGIHTGSVINSTENLAENRTFALNVSKAIEKGIEAMEVPAEGSAKPLLFHNAYVDYLLYTERVKTIELVRNGKVVLKQEMRNYGKAYSDVHSELALGTQPLAKGDVVRYHILGDKRKIRIVEFVVP